MFAKEDVERLLHSTEEWNEWRKQNEAAIPRLAGSDLSAAKLHGANLSRARLHGANLNRADLHSAKLNEARLGEANLSSAKLTEAFLANADLTGANLRNASMFRALLAGAKLQDANLRDANLTGANLANANLEGANLSGACLREQDEFRPVDLSHSNLKNANLCNADLTGANLRGADLRGANLNDANMQRVDLENALLDRCLMINTNFTGANLTGASIYGISAWNLQTEGAKQQDLIVRRSEQDAPFRLDDLEVAQFIYMMVENQRIRKIIDKITSKVVLLLGRFSADRKVVLDGLRHELRTRGYLPIIFDFEKPDNRDLTETIGTLAHLARFVIADLTDAKSLPQELARIIPNLPSVPVQPIIMSGAAEYAMFEHFARYSWVLPEIEYRSLASLLAGLDAHVIAPAEEMARRQTAYPAARAAATIL